MVNPPLLIDFNKSDASLAKVLAKQISVTIEEKEFNAKFPDITQLNLSMSDKIRLALGLKPHRAKAGAKKGNKNAVGNKGRWQKSSEPSVK